MLTDLPYKKFSEKFGEKISEKFVEKFGPNCS